MFNPHSSLRTGLAALLVAASAMTAGVVSTPVRADDNAGAQRSISVTGEAERRVSPDMASLQLEVVSEGENAADARREADAITARALTLLRGAGIAGDDIDTTGLSIAPQYRWLKDEQKQQLTGYLVSRNIEVRLLELDRLGELVTALSDTGINRMQPPRLGLQNEEAVYRDVLAAAAENARDRAAVLAQALGEQLGSVIVASAQRNPAPRPMVAERAMMLAADAPASSPGDSYSSGSLNYRVSIAATFALGDRAARPSP